MLTSTRFIYSYMLRFGITFLLLEIRKRYTGCTSVLTLVHPSHILTPLPGALASYSLISAAFPGEDLLQLCDCISVTIPGPPGYLSGILGL